MRLTSSRQIWLPLLLITLKRLRTQINFMRQQTDSAARSGPNTSSMATDSAYQRKLSSLISLCRQRILVASVGYIMGIGYVACCLIPVIAGSEKLTTEPIVAQTFLVGKFFFVSCCLDTNNVSRRGSHLCRLWHTDELSLMLRLIHKFQKTRRIRFSFFSICQTLDLRSLVAQVEQVVPCLLSASRYASSLDYSAGLNALHSRTSRARCRVGLA